jgi:transposase
VLPGGGKLSRYTVAGGDAEAALRLISKARRKAQKQAGGRVRVVSCYEAGYDCFWLHRWLESRGDRKPGARCGQRAGQSASAASQD